MQKNMFTDARFGDHYRTRDGHEALFLRRTENAENEFAILYVQDWGYVQVRLSDGTHVNDNLKDYDIVSKMGRHVDTVKHIYAEVRRRMLEDYNGPDRHKDEIAQGAMASLLFFIEDGASFVKDDPDVKKTRMDFDVSPAFDYEEFEEEFERYVEEIGETLPDGTWSQMNLYRLAMHFCSWKVDQLLKRAIDGKTCIDDDGRPYVRSGLLDGAAEAPGARKKLLVLPEKGSATVRPSGKTGQAASIDPGIPGRPTQWVPCSERMPPENRRVSVATQKLEWRQSEPVLAWDSVYGVCIDFTKNGRWVSELRGGYQGQVVHGIIAWMPLPEGPSEEFLDGRILNHELSE